jgi:TolB-like protein/Flp pilus assembly protein TadD
MALHDIVGELRRRGVYQVAAIYAAAAWGLLQVADVFFPVLGLPDNAITFLLAAAAAGFPVAILLSWLFDLTPSGIKVSAPDNAGAAEAPGRWRILEFAALSFLVGLVGYLYFERFSLTEEIARHEAAESVDPAPPHHSIAVLPFATMSDEKKDEYFGDGLAEEILNLLAGLKELRVTARTSSFAYKKKNIDIREIARSLDVRHILEGSVRRDGNLIRVTAQLIDAQSGYHLWSQAYDREFVDIFEIQGEIARQVTDSLQLIISPESAERLQERPTANFEAYDYYLRAKDYLRRPIEQSVLDSALSLLQRALALDGDFVEALAATCGAHLDYFRLTRSTGHFENAEQACRSALVLDQRSAEVHAALGDLYLTSGEYEIARQQFDRALELEPNRVDATLGSARYQTLTGNTSEAEALLEQLLQVWPRDWRVHHAMGNFLFRTGRSSEALEYYRASIALTPDNQVTYNSLAVAYFMLGNYAAALEAWEQSLALLPLAVTWSNVGSSYFYLRRYAEAADAYREAVNLSPEDFENRGNLGEALLAAGNREEADGEFRRAIELSSEHVEINDADGDLSALLANYHACLGEAKKARELAQRALELAPQSMYAQFDVAKTYARLGDQEKARTAARKSMDLGYPEELLELEPSLADIL